MKTELVTTLKRQATRVLCDLRESGEPVLITEHGKPSAYLVDLESYEFMQDRMRILENRTVSHAEAKREMKQWLG